jgi:hypothetical protein
MHEVSAMKKTTLVWILLFSVLHAGCAVGPSALQRDHPRYTQALREIQDEHRLLNLVRMRYMETPVFLQVTSINTTYNVAVNANASVADSSQTGASTGVAVGGAYGETPTFTYSLPASQEFFGRMVAPLSAEQLGPLAMSGAGGFFRLGLRRINRLENVSSYTGWKAEEPASYAEFVEALNLLQALERAGLIDFTYNRVDKQVSSPFDELGDYTSIHEAEQIGMRFYENEDEQWVARVGKKVPYLRFAGSSANDPRALRLREILNLDPDKYSFPIVGVDFSSTERMRIATDQPAAAFDPEANFGEIVIVNRSMFEIMGIASRSVQVPDQHLQAGLVAPDEDVLGDLLSIRSSEIEPTNAAIVVQHKGTWFYIEANDLNSKATFLRLNALFEVTAGRVAGTAPILTIPVK